MFVTRMCAQPNNGSLVGRGGKNRYVSCSTQNNHLMEMEGRLTNYRPMQFAMTAADIQ